MSTAGAGTVEWAARTMPALAAVRQRLARSRTLAGRRVGIALGTDPAAANLAATLRAVGAEVSVYDLASPADDVRTSLATRDVGVYDDATEFLRARPEIVLDDGTDLVVTAHREGSRSLLGATEASARGVERLRALHERGELSVPVVTVHDSRIARHGAELRGAGQQTVMGLLDITNLQLAGRVVLVVGYGSIGRGVATHAAALGARVVVSEADAVRGLRAHQDGYRVQAQAEAAPEAEVVVAATGAAEAVPASHLARMRDGVILVVADGPVDTLPVDHLASLPAVSTRPRVSEYTLPGGNRVLVVGDGPAGCHERRPARGPVEARDLIVSLHTLAAEHIAEHAGDRPAGLYPPDPELEQSVARARLASAGATLDQ